MPSIAVIGAGAAGLVASRHLVKCGIRPCIFETSRVVGGSWNSQNEGAYKMWDNLSPNLSKYTCVFSDHLWASEAPAFPTRSSLQNYLEEYSAKYLAEEESCSFRMGCTVTNVKQSTPTTTSTSESFTQPFQVEWMDHNKGDETQSEEFDGVIVATGFFAEPHLSFDSNTDKVLHSSDYRSPADFANETVAVVGSSFSALEIAADVKRSAKKVISVLPRIPYVVPRYVPANDNSSEEKVVHYAPLDTILYRRKTQDAPQTPHTVGRPSAEDSQKRHAFLRGLVGDRKQKVLGIPTDTDSPPCVAISDDYLNLVVDGNIKVVKGRAKEATTTTDDKVSLTLEDGQILEGIDKVIACTGYRSKLDTILDSSLLQTLDYDKTDGHSPLTLCNEAFHPKIPGLGFVGMYRGPYFGVMELQSRLLAGMMSGQIQPSADYIEQALEACRTIRGSTGSDNNNKPPQFPRYDYIGFMDQLAQPLGLVPQGEFGAMGTMVSPPFYTSTDEGEGKNVEWKQAIDDELQKGSSVSMARVALRALIGKWQFKRSIVHYNGPPNQPPQRITGVIDFSHIQPIVDANPGNDDKLDEWNSVLYHEDGIFRLPNGKDMEVFREYEYEAKDNGILEIYFVEGGKRAHLFLSLQFVQTKDNKYWVATSDHLCIEDLYKGTFQIALDGASSANHVTMTYRVKGPNKDYESITDLRPY